MPTASSELRNKMEQYFGDAVNDYGPTMFLLENGWKHSRNWIGPDREISEREWECINFLIQEWGDGIDSTWLRRRKNWPPQSA